MADHLFGITEVLLMRLFLVTLAALVVFAQAATLHAQVPTTPAPSEKQKAAEAEKRQRAKDIDEAYSKTMSRMPDAKGPAADPWDNLRASPSGK
jgi:predicted lipid-binding transport protein (Tim44 family)